MCRLLPGKQLQGTIPWDSLSRLPLLEEMDLSGNSLSGTLPNSLPWNRTITTLNLANNRIKSVTPAPSSPALFRNLPPMPLQAGP